MSILSNHESNMHQILREFPSPKVPRDDKGRVVSRICPKCDVGILQYEGDRIWRCNGLADRENTEQELIACDYTFEHGTNHPRSMSSEKIKVLFLDVDGVLNGCYTRERAPGGCTGVEPAKCAIIRRIVAETGCKIVLSSTWRRFSKNLPYLWKSLGLDELDNSLGQSPILDGRLESGLYTSPQRGHEIQAWLDKHPEVSRFVIVDDDSDMAHLKPHLVQTDGRTGITDEIANKIIEGLNV